ncbi:MAG: hypothetical protein AAB568_02555 [Patescibacteria group bacterium]
MKNAVFILVIIVGVMVVTSIDAAIGIDFKTANSAAHALHMAMYAGLGALILKLAQWAHKK